jgi:transcription elongation GreA/GreB family factor
MEKKTIKKNIIKTCIELLEKNIKTSKDRIQEIIQTANDYEGDHDMFDPFKEDMMKKKDVQVKQMEKFLEDLKLVKKVDPERISDKVEFGAVVITDKQKMFVSAALGKITVDNESVYAISTQVPVYNAMKGLKIGDTFTINNNSFIIKDVF